jgi:hypothetical protein
MRGGATMLAGNNLPERFNAQGVEPKASDPIFRQIGAYLAPHDAPPTSK